MQLNIVRGCPNAENEIPIPHRAGNHPPPPHKCGYTYIQEPPEPRGQPLTRLRHRIRAASCPTMEQTHSWTHLELSPRFLETGLGLAGSTPNPKMVEHTTDWVGTTLWISSSPAQSRVEQKASYPLSRSTQPPRLGRSPGPSPNHPRPSPKFSRSDSKHDRSHSKSKPRQIRSNAVQISSMPPPPKKVVEPSPN